ncbi:MAG: hypothetical protein HY660_02880 [Armatimonadetes bacterium]|nr:hypothetical protein [Armatimonadota bacterium]
MHTIRIVLIVTIFSAVLGLAADRRATSFAQSSSPFAAKYLMAFDACDTSRGANFCRNPRRDTVYLARSNDGRTWSPVPGVDPFPGNVPDLVRRGNTLYVYYLTFDRTLTIPEVLNVRRYDMASGALIGESRATIEHSDGTQQAIVDPSPTIDEQGRIVLFVLVHDGGNPGSCPAGVSSCAKVFLSATEVAGSDGTRFVVDPGARFEITLSSDESATDPDIFKGADGYLLYIFKGSDNNVLAASSGSLRGTFALIPGLPGGVLATGEGGIQSGHYDQATGQYWLYVHTRPPGPGDIAIIRRAVHDAVNTPVPAGAFETVIAGATFPGLRASFTVESPGFTVNEVVAAVDIKPQSCPNPINTRSRGVLPVAILGASDFVVTGVVLTSVRLEGVAPERVALEDVAAPYRLLTGKTGQTDCATAGPDGFLDLSLKFDQSAVIRAAEARLGPLRDGQVVTLRVTGTMADGGSLVGEDVVVILTK